jgi:hypothetical protein
MGGGTIDQWPGWGWGRRGQWCSIDISVSWPAAHFIHPHSLTPCVYECVFLIERTQTHLIDLLIFDACLVTPPNHVRPFNAFQQLLYN